uniref:Protein quiver n=1 Tax=Panagrellus redivivus TaxID=6233 RepID=A0A7E4ZYS2_PANRE
MAMNAVFLLFFTPLAVTALQCYSCFETWGAANPLNFKFENVSCAAGITPRDCNGTCYTFKLSHETGGHHHGCHPGQLTPGFNGGCIIGKTDSDRGTYVICSCKSNGCNGVDNDVYKWEANFTNSDPGLHHPSKTNFIFCYFLYAILTLTIFALPN